MFQDVYERSIRRAERIRDQAIKSGDVGKAQAWQAIIDARWRRSDNRTDVAEEASTPIEINGVAIPGQAVAEDVMPYIASNSSPEDDEPAQLLGAGAS